MHWQIVYDEEESNVPSYSTFKLAYESFGSDIRLMRCKGNFSTCELCMNAAELLRSRKYNKQERKMILEYRRLHLKQQARQRDVLEEEKLKSLELNQDGQPIQCLFFSDAITTTRGDMPYWGKHKSKAHDSEHHIQNRTIGVEVYCGPIKTIFLYHTDEFSMGHGANIMIEVQRQALKDLAELLQEHGMVIPKKAYFQFDNSGENKVNIHLKFSASFILSLLHLSIPFALPRCFPAPSCYVLLCATLRCPGLRYRPCPVLPGLRCLALY